MSMLSQNMACAVPRTRVKICGMTREQDIDAAVRAGADAIGLVFYPPSARHVTLSHAARLRARVPPFVSVAALFVNPSPEDVMLALDVLRPDLLQFHGDEGPVFCGSFGARYLKACRVGAPGLDSAAGLLAFCAAHSAAGGWLFDSHSQGYGGSGTGFKVERLAHLPRGPGVPALVLAGGLSPENVADRIARCRPYAVDVSSGVETAPGIKDADRIRVFIEAVRRADSSLDRLK